jgi:hypothetical protein
MSTSLTTATVSQNALVKKTAPTIARVYVKPAHDGAEIIDRIREASASIADISRFVRVLGPQLDKKQDLPVVEYALARAYYREGRSLSVRQVSLLGTSTHLKTSVEQVYKHMKFLGIAIGEVMTNADASRILCRLNEPDTVH